MMDQIFDRTYQQGRAELNAGIDRLLGTISRELGKSFSALHRIEWSAPWAAMSKAPRQARRANARHA